MKQIFINFKIKNMKLTNQEASLLAKEVHEKLKKQLKPQVPESLLKEVRAYKKKYEELKSISDKAEAALNEHESTWDDIEDKVPGIYASDSVARIIQKTKEHQIPCASVIKDKITLRGLFSKDEDLESFINSIVKEFLPKSRVVAF